MLKVKRFDDAEATVIDHEKGKGRLFDVCGALVMQEKNGTEFRIGSGMDDKMRRNPPPIGSVITFKY